MSSVTKLSLEIIRTYGFTEESTTPDWDDRAIEFHTPNNLVLTAFTVIGNEPHNSDSLEGLDGFICIETKEELDDLLKLSYDQVLDTMAEKHDHFNREDFIE